MRVVLAFALLVAGATPVRAEPATARYAPAQIEMARRTLEEARAAAALGERGRAAELAGLAQVDARIAWAMTNSTIVRAQAAELAQRAERLMGASSVASVGR